MAKSKIKFETKKEFSGECVEQLEGILTNAKSFANSCVNPTTGIYFMQSIFRSFAYNYARFTYIQEQISEKLEEVKKAKNADYIKSLTFDLKRLKYQAENGLDLKAFDVVYSEAAEIYDNMILNFTEDQHDDKIILSFKTSEEILESCFNSLKASDQTQIENDISYLQAFLAM